MGNIKGILGNLLKITIYAMVGIAILRMIPFTGDIVKKYVTGA